MAALEFIVCVFNVSQSTSRIHYNTSDKLLKIYSHTGSFFPSWFWNCCSQIFSFLDRSKIVLISWLFLQFSFKKFYPIMQWLSNFSVCANHLKGFLRHWLFRAVNMFCMILWLWMSWFWHIIHFSKTTKSTTPKVNTRVI